MEAFWKNIEGVKQLLYVGIIFIVVCYACYWGKFDFLTGVVTGVFAALGITPKGEKNVQSDTL